MFRKRQDISGKTYEYDPEIGAIAYGQADAEDFVYDRAKNTYFLATCGCSAATGCQCRKSTHQADPEAIAALLQEKRRQLAAEAAAPATPAPTPNTTPPEIVRAMVAAKREEMRREGAQRKRDAEGETVRRRVRNEIARDFEYLRQVPVTNGYSEALTRLHGAEPTLDIYEDGPVPDGYAEGLKKLGLPEPLPIVRDEDGIPLPYETALQRH